MGDSWRVALVLVVVGGACIHAAADPKAKTTAKPRIECFNVTSSQNSRPTSAVFDARRCQGGGVTWAPILGVLARRHGSVAPVLDESARFSGAVYTLNGATRFAIDEEGDAALFCADDRALVTSMRREYRQLNADAAQLRRAMAEASALEMECLEADGSAPKLPKMNPPPSLPPSLLAGSRARLQQLKQLITRVPEWCFPAHEREDHKGLIRFLPDGQATLSGAGGKLSARGSWRLPRDDSGDDRVEVVLPAGGLFHFNVGSAGKLGMEFIGEKGITREELIPGADCPRALR